MSNPFILYARHHGVITTLESDLRAGLERFWQTADKVLESSAVHLMPPEAASFSLSRNFFSMLFLYSYYRAGIPSQRRILYAAVNQCLRGMVTGCDNLLDDEYKTTLETDLPANAHRFRSVLDIMVADRVLFDVMQEFCRVHGHAPDLAMQASAISLKALTLSGVQEASEEGGITERLPPEAILQKIHHYKTGVLFQSTWAIPALVEDGPPAKPHERHKVQDALYKIGIGCQMLDDIVDLFIDKRERRHNYVASAIVHQESEALWAHAKTCCASDQTVAHFYATCPAFFNRMKTEAVTMLEDGLRQLFLDEHQELVQSATQFIANRIGVSMMAESVEAQVA